MNAIPLVFPAAPLFGVKTRLSGNQADDLIVSNDQASLTLSCNWTFLAVCDGRELVQCLVSKIKMKTKVTLCATFPRRRIGQINSFLGLATGEFEPNGLRPGILLCMLCILLLLGKGSGEKCQQMS